MTHRFGFILFLAIGIVLLAVLPALAEVMVDTAWVRIYNGPGNNYDEGYAIRADTFGNVYVAGTSYDNITGQDFVTIRYYPNGSLAWVKRYNGPANKDDIAWDMTVDGSGNIYVAGGCDGTGFTGADFATMKYYPNGDTAWLRRYNGPFGGNDAGIAIAVDASGYVYVTGTSAATATNDDYLTIKYKPNGDTSWVRRYNGPDNNHDWAYDIVVDGSGNVYVTGASTQGTSNVDYLTIKYKPNGDTAWTRRYNGPGNNSDFPYQLVLDGSNNVCVTGASVGSGTNFDYATIKYYPNGDTAWLRRFNGTANLVDIANDITADASGNVYVTGSSDLPGTNSAYTTVKYYSNGDTAWMRKYSGTGGANSADKIELDGSGNVYVTGKSIGSGTGIDYATIKYFPNGDTAWLKRYNGPASSDDSTYALDVDYYGNVYVTGATVVSGSNHDIATIKYYTTSYDYVTDTLKFLAWSEGATLPIHMIITAPNNDSITPWFSSIPGATYDTLTDLNGDTFPDDSVTVSNPLVGEYKVRIVPRGGTKAAVKYNIGVRINGNDLTLLKSNQNPPGPGQSDTTSYEVYTNLRGDANRDEITDIGDIVHLINYVFYGGEEPNPIELGDANCDGVVDIGDIVHLINYVFYSGNPPCS
jgi:hypothetical protein